MSLTAESIRQARTAAGWTVVDAARRLKQQASGMLPEIDSLVRSWKRWENGTTPSRMYRQLVADVLGLAPTDTPRPTPEIPRVFPNQAAAADDIRRLATSASSIDLLAVRGLGLFALNDSLLRPTIEATSDLRLRVLLSAPGTAEAAQRADEIGETSATFTAGLELALARLAEIAELPGVTAEVYRYATLPVWRIVAVDDTLFVATFAESWEGHESAVYKLVPTTAGTLHRGFRRMFDDIRHRAERII
jgi:hypothetical protein